MIWALVWACAGTGTPPDTGTPVRVVDTTDLIVPPYLQSPTPSRQRVLWITETDEDSIVEWGYTAELGHSASGTIDTEGLGVVHDVPLTDLTPDARVYYRVATARTDQL